MQKRREWSGTPTELHKALEKEITPEERMDKSFPKIASHLTRNLNRSIPTLKQFGIEFDHSASSHKNRSITLHYNPAVFNTEEDDNHESLALPVTWGYRSNDNSDVTADSNQQSIQSEILNQPDKSYKVIDNLEDAVSVLQKLASTGQLLGLDIETTGLNPRRDKICLIQLCDGRETVILDVRRHNDLSVLKPVFARIHAVAHNAVFDMSFLQTHGILIKLECTQLAYHVLIGECTSLKDSAQHCLGITLNKT
jgi:hypothetical protein